METQLIGRVFAPTEDKDFLHPYVDEDEWHQEPVPHRYVHGGFKDNKSRFSIYLPDSDLYQGRFYQCVMPTPGSERSLQGAKGQEDKIGFAIRAGAYLLETNGGGQGSGRPETATDPTYAGYRAIAACAQFSRQVAALVFPDRPARPYGYLFGVSGGAYRTLAAAEHTQGVWDGFVPCAMGSLMAIPNVFSARMLAQDVLAPKLDGIVDALEPGGSGNPYADLTPAQARIFDEVTGLGFPPRSWFQHRTMGTQAFATIYGPVEAVDPTYFEDFWTKQGYAGADPQGYFASSRRVYRARLGQAIGRSRAEDAGLIPPRREENDQGADHSFQRALVRDETMVGCRIADAVELDAHGREIGPVDHVEHMELGCDLTVLDGPEAGRVVQVDHIQDEVIIFSDSMQEEVILDPGTQVRIDNSGFLAMQTYHRHQVPEQGEGLEEWDQFRDDQGRPRYPQRPLMVGPLFVKATGCTLDGTPQGKMIIVQNLLDREAFAWQADWYARRVAEHSSGGTEDTLRLWYTDNALHADEETQEDPTHTVSYLGVQEEALLQISAWVERGIEPSPSTSYGVCRGQVVVPADADARRGIQPTVEMEVDGGARAEVEVGQSLTVRVLARSPHECPGLDRCEWELDGSLEYAICDRFEPRQVLDLTRICSFDKPGTYFLAARVSSQRTGFEGTDLARVYNLARVRVVVKG